MFVRSVKKPFLFHEMNITCLSIVENDLIFMSKIYYLIFIYIYLLITIKTQEIVSDLIQPNYYKI